jgi:hypothetical protein
MKKIKISLIVLLILGVLAICWAIAGDKILSLFTPIPEDGNNLTEKLLVYAKNEDNKLIGVNVPVEELEDDAIQQKFDLLTKNAAMLPAGYYSPVGLSTTLIEQTVTEGHLTLNVSDDFSRSDGRITLECLVMNFTDDEVKDVSLKVEGEALTEFGGKEFTTLTKAIGVNLTFETAFLLEATATTIIEEEDGVITPTTYFHLSTDVPSYILNKTLPQEVASLGSAAYNYTLEGKALTINLLNVTSLQEAEIKNIVNSMNANFQLDAIKITASSNIIYDVNYTEA